MYFQCMLCIIVVIIIIIITYREKMSFWTRIFVVHYLCSAVWQYFNDLSSACSSFLSVSIIFTGGAAWKGSAYLLLNAFRRVSKSVV